MSYIYLMPYCMAKYSHAIVSYENNPSNAHFHRLPKRCALRRQLLAKCRRPATQNKQARVCSLYFKKDDYDNYLQYDSGLASKLILKSLVTEGWASCLRCEDRGTKQGGV